MKLVIPVGRKGKKSYIYLREIIIVSKNFTYKIKWLTNGPLTHDVIDSLSKHNVPHKLLKLYRETNKEPSDTFGSIFLTPTKNCEDLQFEEFSSDELSENSNSDDEIDSDNGNRLLI